MSVIWKVNGTAVANLGITVAGGAFRTQGISYALLDAAKNFDAAQVLDYGDSVTISRTLDATTVIVFQGKVAPISKRANPEYEGHEYPIEDAWADLEKTTYQESWALGADAYFFPKAVLGLDEEGFQMTLGAQIGAIISYAISVGVNLQMGSVPASEILWPKEVENISCAEALNQTLEFHPDWVPWIDHSTVPPTFNVTATDSMDAVTLATDGSGRLESFVETRRDDLIPECVRIIYEYASTIDDEVYRNAVIDKFPLAGPDGGPGVICATIPLAGGNMQMQKSRVRTWLMPDSGDTGDATKKWLKHKYPQLKDVDLEDFEVTEFTTSLYEDESDDADNNEPPPINSEAPKMEVTAVSQIPRELIEGSIEEWMRKKTGRVHFEAEIEAAEGAPEEAVTAIAKGFPPGWCVCTNALSKLYKGLTQWSREEDAPVGIAQGVYESMVAAYQYEGNATLSDAEISGVRYHGKKLTLTGAATSGAMIHSVSWDVGTGKTTLGYGPVPELAPADFLELQRRVRSRKVTWWSGLERADNKLGSEDSPSAAGDSVGGYYHAQTVFEPSVGGGGALGACAFGEIAVIGADTVIRGGSLQCGENNFHVENQALSLGTPGEWLVQIKLDGISMAKDNLSQIFLPGGVTDATGTPDWDNKAWSSGTDYDNNTNPATPAATAAIVIPIGKLTIEDGVATLEAVDCGRIVVGSCGGILSHERG